MKISCQFLYTQYLYNAFTLSYFNLRVMGDTHVVILMCHAVNHAPEDRFKWAHYCGVKMVFGVGCSLALSLSFSLSLSLSLLLSLSLFPSLSLSLSPFLSLRKLNFFPSYCVSMNVFTLVYFPFYSMLSPGHPGI